MFTKKNNSKNTNENNNSHENKSTLSHTLYSWVTGKVGSFLIFTAVGYAIYHFGIIKQLTSYLPKFKEDKGKKPVTN